MNPESIYIHMPYCKTKCPYCDFASFANDLTNHNKYKEYTSALINEIRFRMPADYLTKKPLIKTIFFGGGTPSLHSAEEYQNILNVLQEYFVFDNNIEISLEANPGTIDEEKLFGFLGVGINRISIGVQSFDEALLNKLGRGHSVEDTRNAIRILQALDLQSWSLDLIYGLPKQSLDSWQETLGEALSYNPPHISAYALSIEQNTPYGAYYKNSHHQDLPIEDELVAMYHQAHDSFLASGLNRYEISNWAKPGHEAKHNLTYWYAAEYYAFGLSAHGYINSRRYANTRDLKKYLEDFSSVYPNSDKKYNFHNVVELLEISEDEKLEERIILNLRLASGLDLTGAILDKINVHNLDKLKNTGYLDQQGDRLVLSDKAILVSNKVIHDLVK
jgi:putative oxygen-independent coproporphyrinogen III oxidase